MLNDEDEDDALERTWSRPTVDDRMIPRRMSSMKPPR